MFNRYRLIQFIQQQQRQQFYQSKSILRQLNYYSNQYYSITNMSRRSHNTTKLIEIERKFKFNTNTESQLIAAGAVYNSTESIIDIYYDSENWILASNNYWLRKRTTTIINNNNINTDNTNNNNPTVEWQLKRPNSNSNNTTNTNVNPDNSTTIYQELTIESEILSALIDLFELLQSNQRLQSSTLAVPLFIKSIQQLIQYKHCNTILANINTQRKIYYYSTNTYTDNTDNKPITIVIDQAKSINSDTDSNDNNNNNWSCSIIELELLLTNPTDNDITANTELLLNLGELLLLQPIESNQGKLESYLLYNTNTAEKFEKLIQSLKKPK